MSNNNNNNNNNNNRIETPPPKQKPLSSSSMGTGSKENSHIKGRLKKQEQLMRIVTLLASALIFFTLGQNSTLNITLVNYKLFFESDYTNSNTNSNSNNDDENDDNRPSDVESLPTIQQQPTNSKLSSTTTLSTTLSTTTTTTIKQQQQHPQKQPRPTQQLPPPPLIIGAGQGTTGTHTMHCAICRLGMTSAHWKRDCSFCNITGPVEFSDGNSLYDDYYHYDYLHTSLMTSGEKQSRLRQWIGHPQFKLVARMRKVFQCLEIGTKKSGDDIENMVEWANTMKGIIDDVIRWRNDDHKNNDDDDDDDDDGSKPLPIRNIGAIHDTLHTDVLPYVVESAKRHRGRDPLILLSERDPTEWVGRRLLHPFPLCRLDLVGGPESPVPNVTSHFDWFACIERTLRAKEEQQAMIATTTMVTPQAQARRLKRDRRNKQRNKTKLMTGSSSNQTIFANQKRRDGNQRVTVGLHEVFTTMRNIKNGLDHPGGIEWPFQDLNSHVAIAFEQHQNFWRSKAHLSWNMFERNTTIDDVAAEVHELFVSSMG